ncbi:SDR family oxidoreductase [Persicirhabdus sediminis]|uniref:SDR family NAD(P)-dependent oxidoreductase n=1 Tax=Persicirhabdus sediminis TaxID=454144 RepID=A0A8J7SK42_9BACT|nr:SDR family NAD(P)-dependent oxidoreductase [Persicirhabdus sediminis]MBK1791789.1 SDR family NAD(P)-dependent oxidoreductase [Persicirhabdus sediminis]
MIDLAGKVAVVTGASSGIGKAVAVDLLKEGVKVYGLCRNLAELPAGVIGIHCDMSSLEQIDAAFFQLGDLDILVNSAGVAYLSSLIDGDVSDWEEMWQVNVRGLAYCSQLALKKFPVAGGQIVNISSMSGHRVPPTGGFYAPTKFAVRAVTESLRSELRAAENPTRVASVSPGFVDTPLLNKYFAGRDEALRLTKESMQMLRAEDVARSVMHILETPLHVEVGDLPLRSVGQKV